MADRVSQEAVEVLLTEASLARVSQEAVEVLLTEPSTALLSQMAVEVLYRAPATVDHVSQIAVEVLTPALRYQPRYPIINHQNPGIL